MLWGSRKYLCRISQRVHDRVGVLEGLNFLMIFERWSLVMGFPQNWCQVWNYHHLNKLFCPGFNTKLSSAGLIYKHYGKRVIAELLELPEDDDDVETVYLVTYKNFMEAIDAIDNGELQRFKFRQLWDLDPWCQHWSNALNNLYGTLCLLLAYSRYVECPSFPCCEVLSYPFARSKPVLIDLAHETWVICRN